MPRVPEPSPIKFKLPEGFLGSFTMRLNENPPGTIEEVPELGGAEVTESCGTELLKLFVQAFNVSKIRISLFFTSYPYDTLKHPKIGCYQNIAGYEFCRSQNLLKAEQGFLVVEFVLRACPESASLKQ